MRPNSIGCMSLDDLTQPSSPWDDPDFKLAVLWPINIAWSNTKRAVVAQELKSNLLILCAGVFDLIKSASYGVVKLEGLKGNKMRLFANCNT